MVIIKNKLKKIDKYIVNTLSLKYIVILIYIAWILMAFYFISNLIGKTPTISLVILFIFGIFLLNGGIEGIRDQKVIVRNIKESGKNAKKAGYFYFAGSIFILYVLYYLI